MNETPQQLRVPTMAPPFHEPHLDLRATATLLRRHIWTIIATVVGLMAVTLLVAFQLERQYTATALLVVDSRQSQMLGFEPAVSEVFGLNPAVDTEVEIARSTSVLARVAHDLKLAQSLDFLPGPSIVDRALWYVGLAPEPVTTAPTADFAGLSAADQAKLLRILSKRLTINRLNLTKIISVSAEAKNPEMAAQLANALTSAYIQEQIEGRLNSSQRAVSFLQERVDVLASEISAQEDQIDGFVTKTLAQHGTPEAQELLRSLEQEQARQAQYVTTLTGLESAIEARDYNRVSSYLDTTQQDFAARRKELAEALAGTASGAEVEIARISLSELDQQIRTAGETRTSELRTALAAAEESRKRLRGQLDTVLAQQNIPRDVSVELFQIQRDVETNRNLYGSFLGKLRQAEQQAGFDLPDSRVIAAAAPPERPSFPPLRLITAAAFLLSICGGIGVAVLREYYVGGFTSIEQLEMMSGVPVIASIPRHRTREGQRVESAIVADPLSGFAEAIRRARLGVDAFAKGGRLSIFVTSTLPEEGKTTVALGLARAFALTQRKTLLIDADLRHPSVRRSTSVDPKYTLSQFLNGGIKNDDVIQLVGSPEPDTGLSIILGTEGGTGATDILLMSQRFRNLLAYARENFDVVVIDTSPVGLVVDPQIIANETDLGVYVVRYASTNQNTVRAGLKQLRSTNARLCAVLNLVAREAHLGGKYPYY